MKKISDFLIGLSSRFADIAKIKLQIDNPQTQSDGCKKQRSRNGYGQMKAMAAMFIRKTLINTGDTTPEGSFLLNKAIPAKINAIIDEIEAITIIVSEIGFPICKMTISVDAI